MTDTATPLRIDTVVQPSSPPPLPSTRSRWRVTGGTLAVQTPTIVLLSPPPVLLLLNWFIPTQESLVAPAVTLDVHLDKARHRYPTLFAAPFPSHPEPSGCTLCRPRNHPTSDKFCPQPRHFLLPRSHHPSKPGSRAYDLLSLSPITTFPMREGKNAAHSVVEDNRRGPAMVQTVWALEWWMA